ncbi:MAG: hypothetical protein RL544_647 [Bacteroidota bacterium]|jgi:hypothetical protein
MLNKSQLKKGLSKSKKAIHRIITRIASILSRKGVNNPV